MAAHIGIVQDALRASDDEHDPLAQPRKALAPLQQGSAPPPRRRKPKAATDASSDNPTRVQIFVRLDRHHNAPQDRLVRA